MEPQVGASFIPKKPLTAGTEPRSAASSLLMLAALLLFVASLLAAGGVFGYERLLKASIAEKDESLARAEGAFDTASIQDLVRLDDRMSESERLFAAHVAPSSVFDLLSTLALERVQFTGFEYVLRGDGSASVTLMGRADSFSSLALQSDELGASKALRNVIFSGINIDVGGGVVFTVDAVVQQPYLSYAKYLGGTPPVFEQPIEQPVREEQPAEQQP